MSRLNRHGAVTVLRPSGPLRAEAIESLDEQLRPMLSGGVPYIVIDLSETPLIDGAGLEWVLDLDETVVVAAVACVCAARRNCARDILRITAVGATVQQIR